MQNLARAVTIGIGVSLASPQLPSQESSPAPLPFLSVPSLSDLCLPARPSDMDSVKNSKDLETLDRPTPNNLDLHTPSETHSLLIWRKLKVVTNIPRREYS